MKSVPPLLMEHIQQEVTTLATCITIVRQDGKAFFLTDHDRPILFENQHFVPYDSYQRTSILMSSELEVDTADITAFLTSDGVTRDDVASGLFDYAAIKVQLLNYTSPQDGAILLRKGTFGEVVMNQDETFTAEIRGLTQVLTYRVGESYAPECRADLGDRRCKIGLMPEEWQGNTYYATSTCVLGEVSAANSFVNLDVINWSFESGDLNTVVTAPAGWVAYGDPTSRWVYKHDWYNLSRPQLGDKFIAATRTSIDDKQEIAGMFQDISLLSAGVSEEDLDSGLCRVRYKSFVACLNNRAQSRERLTCIKADGSVETIWDTGEKKYPEDRWVAVNADDVLIPAGTRTLRIDLWSKKRNVHEEGVAYDGIKASINLPDGTAGNADVYGGVMFKCIQAGVSGDTPPEWTNEIGATFNDGTVIWQCVTNYKRVGTVDAVDSNKSFTPEGIGEQGGFYDGGVLYWETGRNAGRAQEIKLWSGGVFTLFQRTYYPITEGDRFVVYPGCDKRRSTCGDKFNNILNFRAEPDVPGQDIYYRTPNAPEQE
ncbi:tail assembly protein [Caulobacter phage CcrRogue]|uniref:Putative tail protein n=1 Tax=Caulobacter phage CcrRogue TaxID=2927986 RepID=K4JS63_9CAUD|nr:tail assembly protein [Caulobacter phage CcrRogue]AFU86578.1 putative tail protein [Caulobacter phage CcrRogue]